MMIDRKGVGESGAYQAQGVIVPNELLGGV